MKKMIRLTESDLRRIVNHSVRRYINEIGDTPRGQYALGRLAARYHDNQEFDKSNSVFDYADKADDRSNYPKKQEMSTAFDQGQENRDFYPQEEELKKAFDEAFEDAHRDIRLSRDVAAQLIADNADLVVEKKYNETFEGFIDLCCIAYALRKSDPHDPNAQSAVESLTDDFHLSSLEYDIIDDLDLSAFEN